MSLSVSPRLAAILERHARPGEPRAATAARLIEEADRVAAVDEPRTSRFLVFPQTPGHVVTPEMVEAALDEAG